MYDEAIEAYDRAMEIDPDYALAWIEKGLEMDPQDADVWSCKGLALYSLGRYEEAVKAYDWQERGFQRISAIRYKSAKLIAFR